ncbi:MAG: DUF2752 domain-containing protein [Bacteroidetes bacterium]|nr:DUF2752 domain-containing protein [Bacteroidota bacterium]MBS1683117.1 DUF2752 domain-containing protein [Bacteroidota bacterium]
MEILCLGCGMTRYFIFLFNLY